MLSKTRSRLGADSVGEMILLQKVIDDEMIFLCCSPMRRYSVFEGLTVSRFECSQSYTESRVDDKRERLEAESTLENEM